jgi:hypothetical protein
MNAFTMIPRLFLVLLALTLPCSALISTGQLSKKEAADLGITMKRRGNGDSGELVWIEFKKEGFLEKLTYCEMHVTDAGGKHLVSAKLAPVPVVPGQPENVISYSFSADPAQLANCSFLIVAYGSSRGDVGYVLKAKDFLELGSE